MIARGQRDIGDLDVWPMVRRVFGVTCRGIAHLVPWAIACGLVNLLALQGVMRVATWELGRGRWVLALWHATWDDGPFLSNLATRVGDAFDGTLQQLRIATTIGLVVATVSTAWFQSLATSAFLDRHQRRRTAAGYAARRFPTVALAWSVPVAITWLFARFAVRPLLDADNVVWVLLGWAIAIGWLMVVFPRLVLVPAFAVAQCSTPFGFKWIFAILFSIAGSYRHLNVMWTLTFWGAFVPVGAVIGLTLALAAGSAAAFTLSIAIVLTGVPLALGGLAAAGAAVAEELGFFADKRVFH